MSPHDDSFNGVKSSREIRNRLISFAQFNVARGLLQSWWHSV